MTRTALAALMALALALETAPGALAQEATKKSSSDTAAETAEEAADEAQEAAEEAKEASGEDSKAAAEAEQAADAAEQAAEAASEAEDDADPWRELEDIPILAENGDRIGEVDDILIDRAGERIGFVVEVGGFLGIGDKEVIMPLDRLKLTEEGLVSDMTEAEMEELEAWEDD